MVDFYSREGGIRFEPEFLIFYSGVGATDDKAFETAQLIDHILSMPHSVLSKLKTVVFDVATSRHMLEAREQWLLNKMEAKGTA